jgi:hypothetical protein
MLMNLFSNTTNGRIISIKEIIENPFRFENSTRILFNARRRRQSKLFGNLAVSSFAQDFTSFSRIRRKSSSKSLE